MKNITTFIGLFIILAVGHTANTWTQMGNITIARSGNIGFSIGTKGYMGLGTTNSGPTNDFWEYNPVADTWTQKANFGGSARELAVGFAIGSKGYVGTGGYANNDFWEYTPSCGDNCGNYWTPKADFSGLPRNQATGFAIGSKGYIGLGANSSEFTDIREYDPVTGLWTNKDPLVNSYTDGDGMLHPSGLRGASVFVIGSFAYVGAGVQGATSEKKFWKFDPTAAPGAQWTAIAPCQIEHFHGVSFTINSLGYIGLGAHGSPKLEEYTPNAGLGTWAYKADFTGVGTRYQPASFAIGTDGYVVGGDNGTTRLSQVWAYSVANAPIIVLPVELKSFTTHLLPNNQQVAVDWETATEEQSDYFAIERQSEFDNSFKEIGRVKAAGNASKKLIYNWLDERILNGISYYRLRMVDKNGRESYSKTTSISYKSALKVRIFPTFTEGEVFIESSGQPVTETFVWNASGLLLQHSKQTHLDLSALPAGFYLVQVKIGNEQFVEKIRRQ